MFDIRTVLVVNLFLYGAAAGIMYLSWRDNRKRFTALNEWLGAFLFFALGHLLLVLRERLPLAITVVLANFLIIGGMTLLLFGIQKHQGHRPWLVAGTLVVGLVTALQLLFGIITPSLFARTLNMAGGMALLGFFMILALVRKPPQIPALHNHPAAIAVVLFTLLNLGRIAYTLVSPPASQNFLNPGTADVVFLIGYSILIIMICFGIVHMINRGLLSDLEMRERQLQGMVVEKDLILHEVHHRIKNNMGNLASLLHIQADQHDNPDITGPLREASSRIEGMMLLYDRLYRSEDVGALNAAEYLEPLVRDIVALLRGRKTIQLELDIDPLTIAAKQLSALALIINELTSNTLKHAFPNRTSGTIGVRLKQHGERVFLLYRDDGQGIPTKHQEGFGLQLLNLLTQQLGGTLLQENRQGLNCKIELPLASLRPDPS